MESVDDEEGVYTDDPEDVVERWWDAIGVVAATTFASDGGAGVCSLSLRLLAEREGGRGTA
jgi:hypothetical protein